MDKQLASVSETRFVKRSARPLAQQPNEQASPIRITINPSKPLHHDSIPVRPAKLFEE